MVYLKKLGRKSFGGDGTLNPGLLEWELELMNECSITTDMLSSEMQPNTDCSIFYPLSS